MLLDRRKVKFWQKIVFALMAVIMAGFLVAIPISRSGCGGQQSATAQVDEEITAQRGIVTAAPNDADAWAKLGELYLERGSQQVDSEARLSDWNESMTALTRADDILAERKGKEAKQQRLDVLNMLVDVQLSLGDTVAATEVYGKITKLTPKDAEAFYEWATLALNAGDTETALRAFKRFVKLDPESPDAPAVKAWIEENSTNASP